MASCPPLCRRIDVLYAIVRGTGPNGYGRRGLRRFGCAPLLFLIINSAPAAFMRIAVCARATFLYDVAADLALMTVNASPSVYTVRTMIILGACCTYDLCDDLATELAIEGKM